MWMLLTFDAQVDAIFGAEGYVAQGVLRVILAMLAGAVVGMEREIRGREAGFRTNALVCMGAALVMVVSYSMTRMDMVVNPAAVIQVDPARIAYGIMTGVGFLGAGAILQVGPNIRGLTTAAGLWCVAALGLAFGSGLYLIGIVATGLVVAALWLMHHLERFLPQEYFRRIVVRCDRSANCVDQITNRFIRKRCKVKEVTFAQSMLPGKIDVTIRLSFRGREAGRAMEKELLDDPGVDLVSIGA